MIFHAVQWIIIQNPWQHFAPPHASAVCLLSSPICAKDQGNSESESTNLPVYIAKLRGGLVTSIFWSHLHTDNTDLPLNGKSAAEQRRWWSEQSGGA